MNKKLKLLVKNNAFKFSQKRAIKRLKKIVNNSSIKPKKNNGKKILFNLVYGMYGKLLFWECSLAKSLQIRGYDVKALICGNALPMCTTEYTVDSVHNDITCKLCVDFSKEFLTVAGIPYSTYNEFLSKQEIEDLKTKVAKLSIKKCEEMVYKDVHIGALSKNSVLRYFKGSLKPDKNEYDSVFRSELLNALISTDIAEKIVKDDKPDVLVTRHLGYSSWGSFAEYCTNNGIRVCSPGEGYKKNTLRFDIFSIDDVNNAFTRYYEKIRKKKLLNADEKKKIQTFIKNRFTGEEGDTADYLFTQGEINKENLDFKKYDRTYAIFPNVPWDSSLRYANVCFDSVYEWIYYTINLFKNKSNYQLIVKIHPSELRVLKSQNTVLDYINDKFDSLPENVKIIPPDTKISPYDLFDYIDVGIVYNGTIGLEMILNDIPVIVAGRTHYGNKGFTYDISTKKEYENILFSDLKPLKEKDIEMAKVYSYFYFIKSFIPYEYITADNRTLKYGWNIESLTDFAEGKNKYLDHICDYIANDIVYQDW